MPATPDDMARALVGAGVTAPATLRARVVAALDDADEHPEATMTTREAIERLQSLVEHATADMLCDKFQGASTRSCVDALDVSWGRPLTPREYAGMCSACRAYWHLLSAVNDMHEHLRTR